jgi:hypothetical protein
MIHPCTSYFECVSPSSGCEDTCSQSHHELPLSVYSTKDRRVLPTLLSLSPCELKPLFSTKLTPSGHLPLPYPDTGPLKSGRSVGQADPSPSSYFIILQTNGPESTIGPRQRDTCLHRFSSPPVIFHDKSYIAKPSCVRGTDRSKRPSSPTSVSKREQKVPPTVSPTNVQSQRRRSATHDAR